MGRIVYFESRRGKKTALRASPPSLPRILAQLIEAGMAPVAIDVLNALGSNEMSQEEALEFCVTIAAVAGIKSGQDESN